MLVQQNLESADRTGLKLFVHEKGEIPGYWEFLEPFVERSCRASQGMMSVETVRVMLADGSATCFGTYRNNEIISVFVVRPVRYADYVVARIIAAAGKELNSAMQWIDVLETWAFNQGAVELEAWCRPGMVRLLRKHQFKPRVEIIARDLRRRLQ